MRWCLLLTFPLWRCGALYLHLQPQQQLPPKLPMKRARSPARKVRQVLGSCQDPQAVRNRTGAVLSICWAAPVMTHAPQSIRSALGRGRLCRVSCTELSSRGLRFLPPQAAGAAKRARQQAVLRSYDVGGVQLTAGDDVYVRLENYRDGDSSDEDECCEVGSERLLHCIAYPPRTNCLALPPLAMRSRALWQCCATQHALELAAGLPVQPPTPGLPLPAPQSWQPHPRARRRRAAATASPPACWSAAAACVASTCAASSRR